MNKHYHIYPLKPEFLEAYINNKFHIELKKYGLMLRYDNNLYDFTVIDQELFSLFLLEFSDQLVIEEMSF